MSSTARILLDSTFLLPTLGIEVEEISDDDLKALASLRDRAEFCCLYQSLVEIMGKVARVYRREARIRETVEVGLRSLLESGTYRWISPTVEALVMAVELRNKGHRDLIDNMLYAATLEEGMYFLTIDGSFIRFLGENRYDTSHLVDVEGLVELLRRGAPDEKINRSGLMNNTQVCDATPLPTECGARDRFPGRGLAPSSR